eukprot:Sdes_comp18108_c0_seq1m7550
MKFTLCFVSGNSKNLTKRTATLQNTPFMTRSTAKNFALLFTNSSQKELLIQRTASVTERKSDPLPEPFFCFCFLKLHSSSFSVKLSSSIVKGIKKPPTYDQKHESEEESFSQSKSPGKGKKCNLGLKSEPKPPSVCVGCNTDPYRVRIDEAFVFSLSMDDIAKLKILIPMREQDPFHQRQAVGVSDKLTLQLKPRTEMLAYSLQQKGIEPRILLTFKATKSLSA